jgi:hypothetical protein
MGAEHFKDILNSGVFLKDGIIPDGFPYHSIDIQPTP